MELGKSGMSDGNIEVQLARIEGKMDVIVEKLNHSDAEINAVRTRLHEIANHVHGLTLLNVPDKLKSIDDRLTRHSQRLDANDGERNERKGAIGVVKVVWALGGGLVTAAIALMSLAIRAYGS